MNDVFYLINDNKVELSNGKEYSLVDFIDLLLNYINQLETNRDEAIAYIKHSWRLKFDQVYDTSKDLQGWEVEELLSILERGKE